MKHNLLKLAFFCLAVASCDKSPPKAATLFDFEKYKSLKVQAVLELVVDKSNGYSNILIKDEHYPLKSYVRIDDSWQEIKSYRTSEGPASALGIKSSEIGSAVELTLRLPESYTEESVLLLFKLDVENTAALGLQDINTQQLSSFSAAKSGVDASSNPQVELSIASSMAVALMSDGDKLQMPSDKISEFTNLVGVLHELQKTMQDNVKRDETFEGSEYVKRLFSRMATSVQTDQTVRANVITVMDKISTGLGSTQVQQVTEKIIATESTTTSSSIFVETSTNSASNSTSTPTPSAPTLTASSPTSLATVSWTAVTNASVYRYKVDSTDLTAGATETTSTSVAISGLSDGSHTVYVQAGSSAGKWSTSASIAVVVDATAPTTAISGQPSGTSTATVLNVTVAGTDVVTYSYKLGATSSTVCSTSTGYSTAIAVATHITDSLSGLADGSVTLCVKGFDSVGNNSVISAVWTKSTVVAPSAPITATKPTGTSYIFPRADDTGAGSAFLNNQLYFLVTTSAGAYMGRASVSGAMDTTFGTDGYVQLSTMTNTSAIATTAATLVACKDRLFGYASKKLYEYNFSSSPKTITSVYDMSTSEGNGADPGPMKCVEDRYVLVPIINNSTNTSAFLIYDAQTNQVLADKVQSPSLGNYPYPIRDSSSSTWYIHYGSSLQALDGSFNRTGSVYTIPSNIAGTNGWSFRSANYTGSNVTLLFSKNAVVRGVNMTVPQFVAHFISGTSTWATMASTYYIDYTVQNLYSGATSISELYGCYAGGKYFFMTYSTVGYQTNAFTFAFGLFGTGGALSSAFNSGSELAMTADPYNYYTARYYTAISCQGNNVSFLRPNSSPYSSTSLIATWLDATQ